MTDQTETARALLYRHGLPDDVIDGALCLHAQELAALQRLRMDELDLTGQKARIVGRIVDLIDPTKTPAPVSSAGPATATGRTTLRQRIARAIHRDRFPDSNWQQQPETVRADYLNCADAVLAELPAPTDQTAEQLASLAVNAGRALQDEKRHYEIACQENVRLRATIERVRRLHDALDTETALTSPDDEITRGAAARKIAAALDGWTDPAELRRMAGEAQQDEHVCKPGATVYYCPASGENESDCHGGFDVCCDRPDLHQPAREAQQDPTQDGEAREAAEYARALATPPSTETAAFIRERLAERASVARQDPTQDGREAHPPQHTWRVETRDPLANEWAPGSHFRSRPHAVERYETANSTAPLWRDGTTVERRIVRETTTYTVEQPTAVARPGQPETEA